MVTAFCLSQAGNTVLKEGLVFHEGQLPSNYRYVFEVAIFNTAAFRELQSNKGWTSFYILHPPTSSVYGHLHLHVAGTVAQTPLRAPFGSLETAPTLSAYTLYNFLQFVESKLASAGVSEILIKNPPDAYHPEKAALLNSFFFTRGYSASADAARREGFEVLRKPYTLDRLAQVIESHRARPSRRRC